jgi:hypothetical protein
VTHSFSCGTQKTLATQPLDRFEGRMTEAEVEAKEKLLRCGKVLIGLFSDATL